MENNTTTKPLKTNNMKVNKLILYTIVFILFTIGFIFGYNF